MICRRNHPCAARGSRRRGPTAWRGWRGGRASWRPAPPPPTPSSAFGPPSARRADFRGRGRCRRSPTRSRKEPPLRSFDGDIDGFGRAEAVVAGPLEVQRPAFGGNGEKGEKRIGRDRREQLGAEDFLAVIFANEIGDDVARDRLARVMRGEAGFADV